ncbi:iron export ABC transporter permease subunit FetB [Anaerocolumna sp. AGMB13025]|uniref:ABC transporter permease n=1 Tax=Anaerocolumna sp. AGMB13025 TaxID=3039116 RepID=UPI00241D6B1F|nr:iron export ABC transporter permease subunit FetB [Anaerocolumna sp. AGMB13025]WFR60050.1 iron export ABC transporter permease subunit FetB [Anaerocolumna sp. AGMB13025]
MKGAVQLNIIQFSMIYLLLLIVLFIMKKSKINQTRLLLLASLRMTVQLVLAGLILTYIFGNPHPAFVVLYIVIMVGYSIRRVLSKSKDINKTFKIAVAVSMTLSGVSVLCFFVIAVVGENIFNPQYTIPLAGMIIGNSMTGITLGLKTFTENIKKERNRIDALLNLGVTPKKVLLPFVNNSLETALLPTLNNMLGMGIVSLPGMMTGQILSGTVPTTAIMYQIAIMIAICTAVCLTVFCSLQFGFKTLYNKRNQINF